MKKSNLLKNKILLFVALSSVLFSDIYIGLDYSQLKYSRNGTEKDFRPKAMILKGTYKFHKNFAIETSLGSGIVNDKKDVIGYENAKVDLDYLLSTNLKTILPMSEKVNLNLLLGVSYIKLSTEANNFQRDGAEGSIYSGIGFDYKILNNIYFETNIIQYFRNIKAIDLGLSYKF